LDTAYRSFGGEVEPIFAERSVSILHAMDLQGTRGAFEEWSVLNKQAFVARIAQVAARHISMGVSMSALKGTYKDHANYRAESERRTVTPYTFCFQVVCDWLLRDVRIARRVHTEGIKFYLEEGHENNGQAEVEFHYVRENFKLEKVLHSIEFVGKTHCRAIQLADLIAYYSRRDGIALLKALEAKVEQAIDPMIRILTEKLVHRGFVATGFHDRPWD
jgi:hypothetical protein